MAPTNAPLTCAAMLVRPRASKAQPGALPAVSTLVDRTTRDPLAPFAMCSDKSYVFSADGTAALAYRALVLTVSRDGDHAVVIRH